MRPIFTGRKRAPSPEDDYCDSRRAGIYLREAFVLSATAWMRVPCNSIEEVRSFRDLDAELFDYGPLMDVDGVTPFPRCAACGLLLPHGKACSVCCEGMDMETWEAT